VQVATRTDVGRVRERNEDDHLVYEGRRLYVVADGLGGHPAGDVASRTAVRAVHVALTEAIDAGVDPARALAGALHTAHETVIAAAHGEPDLRGMGSTAVLAHLSADERELWVAHVGDSRAYLQRPDGLRQVTTDHRAGGVFGNRLSQALGTPGTVAPDTVHLEVAAGDRVLLCSDGLTDMLDDDAIAARVASGAAVDDVCGQLVRDALARGGVDNITVVLVEVTGAPPVSR